MKFCNPASIRYWFLTTAAGMLLLLETTAAAAVRSAPDTRSTLPLYRLTIPQIEALMAEFARTGATVAEKIAAYSGLALGTPYAPDSLGEGSDSACDKDPLMDLSRVDCVTFCEQILALAISSDYEEAFRNLQRIRYRSGVIRFATRNHFVMADWLPNNQWLLKDITGELGGSLCREMTKTIDRKAFVAARGCANGADLPPPERFSISYIPTRHLSMIAAKLKGSEILVLITEREGIFASHLGFIIKAADGSTVFRHASSVHKQVEDEPLEHLSRRMEQAREIAGFAVIAVREDIAHCPATAAP